MAFAGLLAALVCLLFAGGAPRRPAAGFDLPAALSGSNLVCAEVNEPEPPGGPAERLDARLAQAPEPPALELPPMLPPPVAPASEVERFQEAEEASEAIETSSRIFDSQPGDEEMPTIGNNLTVQIVLFGWVLSGPAVSATAQEQKKADANKIEPGDAATRLDKIERQLGDLAAGLKGLKESLEAVSKQLETYDVSLKVQKNTRDAERNTRDIAALREEMERLQKELGRAQAMLGMPEPRKAMSPPEQVQPAPRLTSGSVELVNHWLTPVSVWMDDLSYPLQPGERRVVSRPAGSVNYEVVGSGWGLIQPRRTTTVASGETLTIRIAPR